MTTQTQVRSTEEALTLALEALENPDGLDEYNRSISDNAVTAIKEALSTKCVAQQSNEQVEPVAWDGDCVLGHCGSPAGCEASNCCRADSTTPPQRKPLAGEEPTAQCTNSDLWNCKYCKKIKTCEAINDHRNFGEPKEPEQEPVAHMNQHDVIHEAGYPREPTNRLEPLYTTPPQHSAIARKPLTIDQIASIAIDRSKPGGIVAFVRAIEAAHGITASEAEDSARSKT